MNMIDEKLSERHYLALDGLRGAAALMIVWNHFMRLVPMHGRILSSLFIVSGFTWVGVDLFFVLSGFLITGILVDSKSKKHFFRSFYGRRILRIFPLYYAVLIIVLLILPLFHIQTGVAPDSQIYFWTYTSNYYFAYAGCDVNYLSHLWTLAIEEQFYFLWPLVIYFSSRVDHLRRGLLWALLGVSLLRYFLYMSGVIFELLYIFTFTHCDALILGAYLALSIRSKLPNALRGLRPNIWVLVSLVILALFVLNESGVIPAWEANPTVYIIRNLIKLPLWAILFVWLVYAAVGGTSGVVYKLFSIPVLRWFGKYSYALYVLHMPLAFIILRGNISWLAARPIVAQLELFITYFGVCILCAYLSWHLFEKHFLKLKKYFQPG